MKLYKRNVLVEMPKKQAEFNLKNNSEIFSLKLRSEDKVVETKTTGSGAKPKLLDKQKKSDLLLTAKEMGLDVNDDLTKKQIIDLILDNEPIE